MGFSTLKTYAVYLKPGAEHPLESAVFVKEGFSLWVYVFSIFWAVYHQLWFLVAVILGFYFTANAMLKTGMIDLNFRMLLEFGFLIWISFSANDVRGRTLMKRGHILLDVVVARSEEEARQRLFDRYLPQSPVVQFAPELAV
jgi:hypothetical protein